MHPKWVDIYAKAETQIVARRSYFSV
jgi:hypothetical protein